MKLNQHNRNWWKKYIEVLHNRIYFGLMKPQKLSMLTNLEASGRIVKHI